MPRGVAVQALLTHPATVGLLHSVTGAAGLTRLVDHPRIQKSGLVFAGHEHGVVSTRVQIIGETEYSYLEKLPEAERRSRVSGYAAMLPSCTVITRGAEPFPELLESATEQEIAVLVSTARSSHSITCLHAALDELLAPSTAVHGVLVDIYGIGVLLTGKSGIGKSECALFLVERGHRLVADDRVRVRRAPDGVIHGTPEPLLRHHLEIRGLGILNIRDLFGAPAVREAVPVDLVVELAHFGDDEAVDRLGIDEAKIPLLGVPLPFLRIPVRPGRDLSVLLEVATRNQLLKAGGHHGARAFADRLAQTVGLTKL